MCLEGLARLSRRTWRRFVHESREIFTHAIPKYRYARGFGEYNIPTKTLQYKIMTIHTLLIADSPHCFLS